MQEFYNMYRRRAVGIKQAWKREKIPYAMLEDRIFRGMTLEEAIDLGLEEAERTWQFTRQDGSRLGHRELVLKAWEASVCVAQLIEELESGYGDNRTLEGAVAAAKRYPWPCPKNLTTAQDAFFVGLSPSALGSRYAKGLDRMEALLKPATLRYRSRNALFIADLAQAMHATEDEVIEGLEALKKARNRGHAHAGVMNMIMGLQVIPETKDELGRCVIDPGHPLWEGRVNLSALARHAGLTPATLRQRLRNGWDLKEALETPPGPQGRGAHRKLPGPSESWPEDRSERRLADRERAGLTARTVQERIAAGWEPKLANSAPKGTRRRTGPNISQLAREHGLGPETVRARIKKGMTLQDALVTPLMRVREHPSDMVGSDNGTSQT